jgi:hypothetical protein
MDETRPILHRRTELYTLDVFAGWWRVRVIGSNFEMVGAPRFGDEDQRRMAKDLGYGDDDRAVHAMCLHHDACHVWLSREMARPSVVIDHESGYMESPHADRAQEETLVLAFQKTLNETGGTALSKAFRGWLYEGVEPERVYGSV